MSKGQFPLLDEDARALVRRAATIEAAPEGAKARVLARVESIAGSAGAPREENATSEPRSSFVARALALAAAFALGGAIGALVMYRVMRAPVPIEMLQAPPIEREVGMSVPEALPEPPVAASSQPLGLRKPAAAPRLVAVGEAPAAMASALSASSSTDMPNPAGDERVLLDRARGAIEREDGAEALSATQDHARRYPHGVLVQEREAIAVRALVLLGRSDEARARVERFREHFPDSLLLPALESSTGMAAAP